VTALYSTAAFCADWPGTRGAEGGIQGTFAGVRWGLCGWQARGFPIPPPVAYWLLALTVLGAAAATWWQLERRPPSSPAARWRRMLEVSLIATVAATFFYTHYYYLSVLVLPLNVLLAELLVERRGRSAAMLAWLAAYGLLSAGLLPFSVTSRLIGRDWWTVYIEQQLYLFGELLLIGLLLVEYRRLTGAHTPERSPASARGRTPFPP
jgi:hypothetical protein